MSVQICVDLSHQFPASCVEHKKHTSSMFIASQPTNLRNQRVLRGGTIDLPPSDILQRALYCFGMTFKSTFSPSDHPSFSLNPYKQPSWSNVIATFISHAPSSRIDMSLPINLLDQMRILVALLGEALVRLSRIVPLNTLGILRNKLIGWEVGSFLLRDLGGCGSLTEGRGGVCVGFGHVVAGVQRLNREVVKSYCSVVFS
jgi:hypothetical protein